MFQFSIGLLQLVVDEAQLLIRGLELLIDEIEPVIGTAQTAASEYEQQQRDKGQTHGGSPVLRSFEVHRPRGAKDLKQRTRRIRPIRIAQVGSGGMMARLSFGLSMAIDFECYLIDEITAVGDARFQARCVETFAERRKRADIIMVSHSMETIKGYCDRGGVLVDEAGLDLWPDAGIQAHGARQHRR